jgi:hypothetical protein
MTCSDYKNKKKPKKPKDKELKKAFQVRNYRFFTCNWSSNRKEGYQYYLIVRGYNTTLVRHESDSPKFKSEEEARSFANNNRDYSFVPA